MSLGLASWQSVDSRASWSSRAFEFQHHVILQIDVCDGVELMVDFSMFEAEINEFKQREIYDRIFREEQETKA